ncbi:MAG TPA: glycosyltransferase [Bryobacteraceae bacterium]|jgi:cellulose synthase/poly-beta-1,6-N-acetylglucosamine synthase-like glycosyltransferase|nr:glycosyltransferase [Bryobacteraceae bacterium]
MTAAVWLFWLSVAWVGYVWIGYPLILAVLTRIRSFRPQPADGYYPAVSVLIAARNEAKDIGWKLAQTLAWDYPADRFEVLVGSDASTDGTDEIIRAVGDARVRFVRNQERAGKTATLNLLARLAQGEVLFFTDANTHIEPECLKAMVRHFADPRIGCVTGMERNVAGPEVSTMTAGSNAYLDYECTINTLESKLGSVLVCDGSVYCLRRSLFTELDRDLANDLEHPLRAGSAGSAIVYEPRARSYELCTSLETEEFRRRRRIAAQGALAMWRLRHELRGLRLWQFLSRKFLRWLTVLPLGIALAANALLRHEQFFAVILSLQIAFYGLALLGARRQFGLTGLLRLPFVFLLANVAVFMGVLDACRRKTFATWNIAELSRGSSPQRG